MKKKFLKLSMLVVTICITSVLLTGCPTSGPKAPKNATELKIDGNMVTAVLEAWKEHWYTFDVKENNTPLLFIFKNLGDANSAWVGYQKSFYYYNPTSKSLQLIRSDEVPPTKPADTIYIVDDKARSILVLPYKGKYYIRIYGYAQPISENKKFQLSYVIGLATPEKYSDATEIKEGESPEVSVLGDKLGIYALGTSPGSIYNVKVEKVFDTNIVGEDLSFIGTELMGRDKNCKPPQCEETTLGAGIAWKCNPFERGIVISSVSTNALYLILSVGDEFGYAKAKISLKKVPTTSLSKESTVQVKGEETKYIKLEVTAGKSYRLTFEEGTQGDLGEVYLHHGSITSDEAFDIDNGIFGDWFPNNFTAVKNTDYYLILKGISDDTDASIKVKLEEQTTQQTQP